MSLRQFGTLLGVALISTALHRRETLHSGRLFEHLRPGNGDMSHWIASTSQLLSSHDDYTSVDATRMALKMLDEASARQASTLAYADALCVMAIIGLIALCLVPPSPATKS
jgi:MFS transporter, DHA2 family, multidrug resistance protein